MEEERKNHVAAPKKNPIFKKLSDDKYFVNSPCFLTVPSRVIQINGTYLKVEGPHFDAVKILNVHYKSGFIYLKINDLKTGRVYQISHIIGDKYPCIWWLLSWDFIENDIIRKLRKTYSDDSLLEFDF